MRLVVARIGRAHGIRGEVTIEVRTDVPDERFVPGAVLFVAAPAGPVGARRPLPSAADSAPDRPTTLTVRSVRDHNGILLLGLEGIGDRNAAEELRGLILEAEITEDDEPDAWYDHQLVGLAALAPDGTALGSVVDVEHAPAQDLLVVRRPDGTHRLVPLVTAIVPTVDLAAGHLVIDAPAGLLDDVGTG